MAISIICKKYLDHLVFCSSVGDAKDKTVLIAFNKNEGLEISASAVHIKQRELFSKCFIQTQICPVVLNFAVYS